MAEVQLPSNSHKSRELATQQEEKRVSKPVVKGTVTHRKKSLGTKFAEMFISEEATDVKGYLLMEVVVPTVKSLISDMVTSGIEMMLYGESTVARRRPGYSTNTRTSYSSYYHNKSPRDRGPADIPRRSAKSLYNYEEVILDNRQDADLILDNMVEILDEYRQVSVADLYDLADMESTWADNKYGWTDLSNASVQRIREGYLIKLPKAREL